MRIKSSNRTPYLSRRDQLRLAMMVGLVGLVVIAMDYAGRPSSYAWFFGSSDADSTSSGGTGGASDEKKTSDIDFRPDVEATPEGVELAQPRTPKDATRYQEPNSSAVGVSSKVDAHDLEIEAELIAQIKDNAVGIRPSERDLQYYLLAKTRDVPLAAMKAAARGDIAFGVVMNDSPSFLCTLMTVRGEIRRLNPMPVGVNDYGVDKFYEAWLFNRDSGNRPYRIICTSIPEGIPMGIDLKSGTVVTATGYYFKRYGYPAVGNRLHVAPMIISKTLEWHRPFSATRRNEMDIMPYVLGVVVVFGLAAGFTLWRFRKSDREFERLHLKRLTGAPEGAILALENIATIEIGEALRQIGDAERAELDETG